MVAFLYCLKLKIGEIKKISHFNCHSKHYDKYKFVLKLTKLLTVYNLVPLEVVQKCQFCQLCVLRPSRHSSVGPGFEPHHCLLTGTWKRLAQLAAKRSAGVTPEANLREC